MKRPNIVWLVADHLAFSHHREHLNLPTYDRLCAEGVAFEQAYSVCPQCGPARASMLTGQYPHHHGMLVNDGASGVRRDFEPDARLFSHRLAEAGYSNGYFGKWHCGIERTAQDYGFEGFSMPGYGLPYRSETYHHYLEELGLPEPQMQVDWALGDPEQVGKTFTIGPNGRGPFVSAGHFVTPPETHEAKFVAHLAAEWLRHRADAATPFCLRVDVWGPHHPYHSADPFVDNVNPDSIPEYPSYRQTYEGLPLTYESCRRRWTSEAEPRPWAFWQPALARCYEQVMLVDAAFGDVLDTLDEMGLAEDTLVIMTADHGDLIASHGDLFNKDCLMVEETTRIPMALRWPKGIAAGSTSQALVSNLDLVPTVLAAAGADQQNLDGQSLLDLARDPHQPGRDSLMCEHHGGFRLEHFQRMLRWQNYKYVAHLDDYDELYDLSEDPYELNNLVWDPGHGDVLHEVRGHLLNQMRSYQDNARDARRLIAEIEGHRLF